MIKKTLKSFSHAFRGIQSAFKTEMNLRIHMITAFCTISLGLLLRLDNIHMAIIFAIIGVVISAELFNTVIEKMMDFITTDHSEEIKVIKDIASAAVLMASIFAFIVGMILFLPPIFKLIFHMLIF